MKGRIFRRTPSSRWGVPTNRLLVYLLPAHVHVVRRRTVKEQLESLLQVLGRGETCISSGDLVRNVSPFTASAGGPVLVARKPLGALALREVPVEHGSTEVP